jgi:hypothetical protein
MAADTFVGIAPVSVPLFVLMQLLGGALGVAAVLAPSPPTPANPVMPTAVRDWKPRATATVPRGIAEQLRRC